MYKIEEWGLKILEKIGLKKIADLYRAHKEGMRYLIFGGLSTLINILTYIVCAKVIFKGLSNANMIVNVSEIIAFIIALIFAYITNKIYVFESKTKGAKKLIKEFSSFTGCRIFTEIISIIMMNMTIWFGINDVFMKIFSNIVVIILNYVFSKIIIFKK